MPAANPFSRFTSFEFIVRPDDDEVFDAVEEGNVVMDGRRIYVPESLWPLLEAELMKLPQVH